MNNSRIYGGGIALYESSHLLLKSHTYFFILYHVWDCFLSSCRSNYKWEKFFKKPEPSFNSDDTEFALITPGTPAAICETSTVSVVSVEMRQESLLFDENNNDDSNKISLIICHSYLLCNRYNSSVCKNK